MEQKLTFKIATEVEEYEQIHALNYKTFVKEIPQHGSNEEGKLVDKFHSENTYCICLRKGKLLGMLACRGNRPFSLDHKLSELDSYLPPHQALCEIRLLAVEKEVRGGRVLLGLMNLLYTYCSQKGYDLALISGTVRQLKLYKHLGFVPFGQLVGPPEARYQPMYIDREMLNKGVNDLMEQQRVKPNFEGVNFLPGPVRISGAVQRAFMRTPISHRSDKFLQDISQIKSSLTYLVNSKKVQILLGSGTLANDVVAAHLSLNEESQGIVLSNGEFGERLIDHALRARLLFKEHKSSWGEAFDYDEIESILDRERSIKWLWAVHLETSTGVLNDLSKLKMLCSKRNILLCLDCVSSIGALPVDLEDVFLASGVSGKAICSYPGLSFVFYNQDFQGRGLPRYMDLDLYSKADGVPFTHSSNLIYALKEALIQTLARDFSTNKGLADRLRGSLRERNLEVVAPEVYAAPNVITFSLPEHLSSEEIGKRLEDEGFFLSYRSAYLLKRNWLQICLMGEYDNQVIDSFPEVLAHCL